MTDGQPVVRRLLMCVIAVTLALGGVMVMRIVAQYVAGTVTPATQAQVAARVETGANAPRVYVLADMIPPEWWYSVVGRPCRRKETSHMMPIRALRSEKEAEALARGWEPLSSDDPTAAKFLRARRGTYYKTKDGRFVTRQFWSENRECSHMVEIELPDVESLSVDMRRYGPEPELAEFAGLGLVRFRQEMPPLLRDTVIGTPVFTALQRRENNGGVFYVTAIEMKPLVLVEKLALAAAERAGWTRLGLPPGMAARKLFSRDNLSMTFDCQTDSGHVGQTVISYRISDDEVRVKPKRSENENG